ncbi:MAG TPA: transcriptional regulator [Tenuifilaceae bacterium]|nr:transcriptional regulator [Tenuifilaceae bacterium]
MYDELDPILHSPLRLAIVSLLIKEGELDFNTVKEKTNATSGNISVQFKKLEEAGYITINKSFRNNYPHTAIIITKKGLMAFEEYVKALRGYLDV